MYILGAPYTNIIDLNGHKKQVTKYDTHFICIFKGCLYLNMYKGLNPYFKFINLVHVLTQQPLQGIKYITDINYNFSPLHNNFY